jgi:hypothetical protein
MHRLRTTVVLALSTWLFVSTGSAQQTATTAKHNPPGLAEYILQDDGTNNGTGIDSNIYQDANGLIGVNTTSPTAQLEINGNVNLTTFLSQAYRIGGINVLSTFNANLLVGANACPALKSPAAGNTCVGNGAGLNTTTGTWNTFSGLSAGLSNTVGKFNTFTGMNSGFYSNGDNNTFIGAFAGVNNTAGSGDIYLGNQGCPYPCTESSYIRIGNQDDPSYPQQTAAYISGIYNESVDLNTAQYVFVDASGKLGTLPGGAATVVMKAQQEHIQTQAREIADLQQRLARLESLIAKK